MVVGSDTQAVEALLATALSRVGTGAEAEAMVRSRDLALTRFAMSHIHQNLAEQDATLRVRIRTDGRTGVASTNRLNAEGLRDVVDQAAAIARLAAVDPDPAPLATGDGTQAHSWLGFSAATAEADPDLRAAGARAVIAAGEPGSLDVSGAFSTERSLIAVANTTGLLASHEVTQAKLLTVMMGAHGSSGYAQALAGDVANIDPQAVGEEAARRAEASRNAVDLKPGDYPVVLGAYAVATVLEYLSFIAFSGLALEEGRSCMELGDAAMGGNVSIWDDGRDPSGIPATMDYEGVSKQRVNLVEGGVARAAVHDSATAHRAQMPLTGHGLPAPNTFGPLTWNLFMAPGDSTHDDLVAGLERGVLVTRFHYVNIVHPKKGILTGMTKDGTFLVEDGKVVGPVRNLRFTQSIPEAFSHLSAIGAETRLVGAEYSGITARAPAVRADSWTFTGATADEGTVA